MKPMSVRSRTLRACPALAAVLATSAWGRAAPAPSASAPAPSASAPAPSASAEAGAPADMGPPRTRNEPCDDDVLGWAKRAGSRGGLTIEAVSCNAGLVRLSVGGAGCDFEVTHGKGFRQTRDGDFAVSPIVELEWDQAPEPMRRGLDTVVAALEQDPGLTIHTGAVVRRFAPEKIPFYGYWITGGCLAAGVAAAALALLTKKLWAQ
jgi:hypothetical protein